MEVSNLSYLKLIFLIMNTLQYVMHDKNHEKYLIFSVTL